MTAEQKKERRFHYAYVVATGMFLSYILSTFMYGSDQLFLTPVINEFGCSQTQWGITKTIWMFSTGLIMPTLGKMYEKYEKISGVRNGSMYGDGKYDGLWIRKI